MAMSRFHATRLYVLGLALACAAAFGPARTAQAQSWTGFYVGLNAGYGWGQGEEAMASVNTFAEPFAFPFTGPAISAASRSLANFSTSHNMSGWVGGGQLGYNVRLAGSLVVGIEADLQDLGGHDRTSTIGGTALADNTIGSTIFLNQNAVVMKSLDYLGTVRGRLGYLITPTVLGYVTGGLAYGRGSASTSVTHSCSPGNVSCAAFSDTTSFSSAGAASETRVGWTIGGGVEWDFARNWSLKGEYLYYDLGSIDYTLSPMTDFGDSGGGTIVRNIFALRASADFSGHLARIGINYKF